MAAISMASTPMSDPRVPAPMSERFLMSLMARFKKYGIKYVDYKDIEFLKKFINEQGKLLPRRLSGNSLKYQRKVQDAVKKARQMALLPYVTDLLK